MSWWGSHEVKYFFFFILSIYIYIVIYKCLHIHPYELMIPEVRRIKKESVQVKSGVILSLLGNHELDYKVRWQLGNFQLLITWRIMNADDRSPLNDLIKKGRNPQKKNHH